MAEHCPPGLYSDRPRSASPRSPRTRLRPLLHPVGGTVARVCTAHHVNAGSDLAVSGLHYSSTGGGLQGLTQGDVVSPALGQTRKRFAFKYFSTLDGARLALKRSSGSILALSVGSITLDEIKNLNPKQLRI